MDLLSIPRSLMNFSQEIPDILPFERIEQLFEVFNGLFFLFFSYSKYIFALILFLLGFLSLFKFRGIYRNEKISSGLKDLKNNDWKDKVKKTNVIVGMIYIFMSFGIIFNFFTYILIWVLDPLPDKLIFEFMDISGIFDPEYLYHLSDINSSTLNPFEKTFYYFLALISFVGIIQIVVCVYYIIKDGTIIKHPARMISLLLGGVVEGILVGFTTALLFFV